MAIALLTTYLAGYRMPLYERLARDHGVEVLCYAGGERYVPPWFASNLDAQLAAAPFPARRLRGGAAEAFALSHRYAAVIAPYAGGAILPAAYLGARRFGRAFVLWASVWAQPWSVRNALALPMTRHIYRNADAVVAYGEHVRRFVAGIRHRDDVVIAPQSVEAELFGRAVDSGEIAAFRARAGVHSGAIVLYVGRLVPEKGVDVLLEAWRLRRPDATLVVIGDGPLAGRCRETPRVRLLGPLAREELPVAYAASHCAVLASVPTRRFREPWGLVCNEAMHQGRPVVATTAVGAVAGGLVRDGDTGLVVAPGDAGALGRAIERLVVDDSLRRRLGRRARDAVRPFNYDAMAAAFDRALAIAMSPSPIGA